MERFYPEITREELERRGIDSIVLMTGDGVLLSKSEFVIYDPARVLNVERI